MPSVTSPRVGFLNGRCQDTSSIEKIVVVVVVEAELFLQLFSVCVLAMTKDCHSFLHL